MSRHACHRRLSQSRAVTLAQAYWVQRLERAVTRGKDASGFISEQKELERVRRRAQHPRASAARGRLKGPARAPFCLDCLARARLGEKSTDGRDTGSSRGGS